MSEEMCTFIEMDDKEIIKFLNGSETCKVGPIAKNVVVKAFINNILNNQSFTVLLKRWRVESMQMFITILNEVCQNEIPKEKCRDFFIKWVVSEMMAFETEQQIRDNLIEVAFMLCHLVPVTDLNAIDYQMFLTEIYKKYIPTIVKLKDANYPSWHKLWIFLVKFCAKKIHNSMDLTNRLLRIVEFAFRNSSFEQRLKGYDCWKELIDNASLDPTHICTSKQIKLLITPLRAKFSKQEVVICKRFDVFVYLLEKLQQNAVLCLPEFLEFCFGSVGDPKSGQAKGIPQMGLKSANILLSILGHSHKSNLLCISEDIHFEKPLVHVGNIDKFYEILIHSVAESCLLLKDDDLDGKRETVIKCLWGSLFNLVVTQLETERIKYLAVVDDILGKFLKQTSNPFCEDLIKLILESLNESGYLEVAIPQMLKQLITILVTLDIGTFFDDHFKKAFTQCLSKVLLEEEKIKLVKTVFDCLKNQNFEGRNILNYAKVWILLANELTTDFNREKIHELQNFEQFLNWPTQNLHRLEDAHRKLIVLNWLKLYRKLTVDNESKKMEVLKDLEKSFKNNPLLSTNVCSLLNVISQFETKFSNQFVSKLMEVTRSILQLPNLNAEEESKLYPLVMQYFEPSLECFKSENIEGTVKVICSCIERLLSFNSGIKIVDPFVGFMKSSTGTLREYFSKYLKPVASELYNKETDNDNIVKAREMFKIVAIFSVESKVEEEEKKTFVIPSGRSARIAIMGKNSPSSPKKTAKPSPTLRLFGKDPDTMSPLKIKGSQLNNTPTPKQKRGANIIEVKTINARPLNEENSLDFVPIQTEVTLQRDKLNEHQKEVLKKRREDIPALYQDLSQSMSQDMFSSKCNSREPNQEAVTSIPSTLSKEIVPDSVETQASEVDLFSPIPKEKDVALEFRKTEDSHGGSELIQTPSTDKDKKTGEESRKTEDSLEGRELIQTPNTDKDKKTGEESRKTEDSLEGRELIQTPNTDKDKKTGKESRKTEDTNGGSELIETPSTDKDKKTGKESRKTEDTHGGSELIQTPSTDKDKKTGKESRKTEDTHGGSELIQTPSTDKDKKTGEDSISGDLFSNQEKKVVESASYHISSLSGSCNLVLSRNSTESEIPDSAGEEKPTDGTPSGYMADDSQVSFKSAQSRITPSQGFDDEDPISRKKRREIDRLKMDIVGADKFYESPSRTRVRKAPKKDEEVPVKKGKSKKKNEVQDTDLKITQQPLPDGDDTKSISSVGTPTPGIEGEDKSVPASPKNKRSKEKKAEKDAINRRVNKKENPEKRKSMTIQTIVPTENKKENIEKRKMMIIQTIIPIENKKDNTEKRKVMPIQIVRPTEIKKENIEKRKIMPIQTVLPTEIKKDKRKIMTIPIENRIENTEKRKSMPIKTVTPSEDINKIEEPILPQFPKKHKSRAKAIKKAEVEKSQTIATESPKPAVCNNEEVNPICESPNIAPNEKIIIGKETDVALSMETAITEKADVKQINEPTPNFNKSKNKRISESSGSLPKNRSARIIKKLESPDGERKSKRIQSKSPEKTTGETPKNIKPGKAHRKNLLQDLVDDSTILETQEIVENKGEKRKAEDEDNEDIIESSQESFMELIPILNASKKKSPKIDESKLAQKEDPLLMQKFAKELADKIEVITEEFELDTQKDVCNSQDTTITQDNSVETEDTLSRTSNPDTVILISKTVAPVESPEPPQKLQLTESELIVCHMDTMSVCGSKDPISQAAVNVDEKDSEPVLNSVEDILATPSTDSLPSSSSNTPGTPRTQSLPASPVTVETPNRTNELLDNTMDISPITSRSNSEEDIVIPAAKAIAVDVEALEKDAVTEEKEITQPMEEIQELVAKVKKLVDDSFEGVSSDDFENMDASSEAEMTPLEGSPENNPESLDFQEPSCLGGEENPIQNGQVSTTINIVSNRIYRAIEQERSTKIQNLIQSISNKPFVKRKSGTTSSPSTKRIKKLFINMGQKLNHEEALETFSDNDILTFSREIPSPLAVPKSSILKRKFSDSSDGEGISPCAKRKRVNFSDPCLTSKKIFLKEDDQPSLEAKCLFDTTPDRTPTDDDLRNIFDYPEDSPCSEISTGTDSELPETEPSLTIVNPMVLHKNKPIFAKLVDCQDDVLVIVKKITSPMFLSALMNKLKGKNVKTVGDLARLSEAEVNRFPFKVPVVMNTLVALENYYKKKLGESAKSEEKIENTREDERRPREVEMPKLDVKLELKMLIKRAQRERVPTEQLLKILLPHVDNSRLCSIVKSHCPSILQDTLEEKDYTTVLKIIIDSKGISEILKRAHVTFHNAEKEHDFYQAIAEYVKYTVPLEKFFKGRSIEDLEGGIEESIKNKVFQKSEVIENCLLPLIDSPEDISAYLNSLTTVAFDGMVVSRLKRESPVAFFQRIIKACSWEDQKSVSELLWSQQPSSPSEIVACFEKKLDLQSDEEKSKSMIEMFKFVSEKLDLKTLVNLHVDVLHRISNALEDKK